MCLFKIVHIIPSLEEGGAERFVVDLCNALSVRKEVKVYLITLFDINEKMFLAKHLVPEVTVVSLKKRLGFDLTMFGKLYRLIGEIKPNIVHTHLRTFDYNWLNLLLRNKIHYFHTLHSDALVECPSLNTRIIRKYFYRRNVVPVTISEQSSVSFQKTYNLNNDVLIYNGRQDLVRSTKYKQTAREFKERFRLTENTRVIVNVANISPIKNQLELVQAITRLTDEKEDVVLLLIGIAKSAENEQYEAKIANYLNDRIFVLGVKDNVEDYLFLSDAFCLSSVVEGMPITIIESFSAGCIPVCTPVGGIPNMITDGWNGILGKGSDKSDIYRMIKKFLQLPEYMRIKMKDNARSSFLNNFSIDNCVKHYLELYHNTFS